MDDAVTLSSGYAHGLVTCSSGQEPPGDDRSDEDDRCRYQRTPCQPVNERLLHDCYQLRGRAFGQARGDLEATAHRLAYGRLELRREAECAVAVEHLAPVRRQEDGPHHGNAERATELPRGVVDCRPGACLVGRQGAHDRLGRGARRKAEARGDGSGADQSSFNIARVAGSGSYARAGASDFDAAGQGNFNTARVFGDTSTAEAGPGNGRRAIIVGSNQTKNDPPRDANARRAAASVRSAAQR